MIKSKILRRGLGINPIVNKHGMGLQRCTLVADLDRRFDHDPLKVFLGMDEKWFLSNVMRTIPDGRYIIDFDVPRTRLTEHRSLVKRLQEIGFIAKVHEELDFEWGRINTMRAEFFDFKRSRWDFDWTRLPEVRAPPVPVGPPVRKIDPADLSLTTMLNLDPCRSLAAIAKAAGVRYGAAVKHMRHMKSGGFFVGYNVSWVGAQDPKGKTDWLKSPHKYLQFDALAKDVEPEDLQRLRNSVNRLPFLWFESGGKNYHAQFYVPLELVNETMEYLRRAYASVRERTGFYIGDWNCALGFTLPRSIFDARKGEWIFDVDAQVRDLEVVLETMTTVRR